MTLHDRYARLLEPQSVSNDELAEVERRLGVQLPESVRRVSGFFPGDLLGGIAHKAWTPSDPDSVVSVTSRLREAIGLPKEFVVLAEQPESFIVLDTGSGKVMWVHNQDARNLAEGRDLSDDTDRFEDYERFIDFLVDQEADEQEFFNQ